MVMNCAKGAEDRASLLLDGKWQGRMDPEKVGEKRTWFSAQTQFKDQANVPGCWDNEGLRHGA